MDISQMTWRKASYSGSNGGGCVEVASTPAVTIAVRDSTDPGGPALAFASLGWQAFTSRIKDGTLHLH